MEQSELWHDSLEEALRDVVVSLGGPKRVGAELWPAKPLTDAARYLNHCLDNERAEKLGLGELMWILKHGRQVGCHIAMQDMANELGYQITPLEPEDEIAELQRQFIQAREDMQSMLTKMEKAERRHDTDTNRLRSVTQG